MNIDREARHEVLLSRFNHAIEDHLVGLLCAGTPYRKLGLLSKQGAPNAVTITVAGVPVVTLSHDFVDMKFVIYETYHND
ncbi:MAG: hypothetical protein IPO08_18595 [Xanthomonadales bacterium]|nr:hypothetical protein [Xanthomonadales bacterium]